VDQYRLLVADACAGLASMFTLEAMGLLFMALRGPAASRWRDAALALLLVPIALLANVVRVVVLVLVVHHFGEAAVQGLMHGLAGLILFGVAMLLMLATDGVLARLERRQRQGPR
jgi:exosortase